MTALFVALGIAVLTLLALLLWFVPHLLQQQALRSASESAQLREMLLDVLNEQEAVTLRQTQLSTSMTHLQTQLEQMLNAISTAQLPVVGQAQNQGQSHELRKVEERLATLQQQLLEWDSQRMQVVRTRAEKDNESWGRLMELLGVIQERVGELSRERSAVNVTRQANNLMEELEQEMGNLRSISEDIARLQWRLRRSLTDRDTGMANLLQSNNGTRAQSHA